MGWLSYKEPGPDIGASGCRGGSTEIVESGELGQDLGRVHGITKIARNADLHAEMQRTTGLVELGQDPRRLGPLLDLAPDGWRELPPPPLNPLLRR